MIEIPVHNTTGDQVGTVQLDEQVLGGEVRPALLKQAYVRTHANRRMGTAATKTRSQVEGSTRKLYRQKGTGNARRGSVRANILRGGGHSHAKSAKSWRQAMPAKMRRLANRNAVLAKAVDGEIKLIDNLAFDKPSTAGFAKLLGALQINRSCLFAVPSTTGDAKAAAKSAANLPDVSLTLVDQLHAFEVLNHRFLLVDRASFEAFVQRAADELKTRRRTGANAANGQENKS